MKASWCAATALTLVAAVSLSPAMAQGPKPSGGNTWPGISQRVVPSSSTAEECGVRPALGFARLRIAGQVAACSLCLGHTDPSGNRA